MKKYKMIQIPEESYNLVKEYCIRNDKKMGAFVSTLIKQAIVAKPPTNVLKVNQ